MPLRLTEEEAAAYWADQKKITTITLHVPSKATSVSAQAPKARKRATETLAASEAQIQALITDFLRLKGYVVKSTVRHAKKCPQCGTYSHRPDGVDRGVGDLLIRHSSWLIGLWVNADIKTTKGKLSIEQQVAVDAGELFIWRDPETALADLEEFDLWD